MTGRQRPSVARPTCRSRSSAGANPPPYPTRGRAVGPPPHWQLDDAGSPVADSSGNGNTGNIVGGVTTGQPGAVARNSAITTNGIDGFVTLVGTDHPDRGVHRVGVVQDHHRPGRRHHGLLRRRRPASGRATTAPSGWTTTARSSSASGAATSTNPGNASCAGSAPTTTASGTRPSPCSTGPTTSRSTWTARSSARTNITQPIVPAAGLPAGRLPGPRPLLHRVRIELRRQAARHELLLAAAASTRRPCTRRRSLPSRSRRLYASGSAHGAPLPPEQADPGPPPPPPPPSAYPPAVLADAPSMYWQLGELGQLPVADSSGLNRIGTYRNGLTFGQPDALVNGSDTASSARARPASPTATRAGGPDHLLASRRGSRRARSTAARSSVTKTPRPVGASTTTVRST